MDPTVAPTESSSGVAEKVTPANEPIQHKGFIALFGVGAIGCTGSICGNHSATPGVRVDGLIGGNIGGFLELGLAGGWGKMKPRVQSGTNATALFGLDPTAVSEAAELANFDLNQLDIQSADLSTARVGPSLRLHLPWKGRVGAFAGVGLGYNLFRGKYGTTSGAARLDFHGFDLPLQTGLAVYINRTVAVGLQFDYAWTFYQAVALRHPQQNMVAPLSFLDEQLSTAGTALIPNLPKFWSATLGLRLTL